MFKNFLIMMSILVLLAWNAVEAQPRFFHKPVTLEAKATDIDFEKRNPHKFYEPVLNELGETLNYKSFEVPAEMQKLETEMQMWRLRNRYWGQQQSIDFIKRLAHRHG